MYSGLRILIVDDNEHVRKPLADKAQAYGARVIISVDSGDKALAILRSEIRLDAVISDNSMPHSISGVELLKETRKLPHRQEMHFTLYTADLWGNSRSEAQLLGAVVDKPSKLEEIFTIAFSQLALGQLVRS
jgi:CheY-like chemotaxis protein